MKHSITRKSAAFTATGALLAAAAAWPSVAGADSSRHRGGQVVIGSFTADRVEEAFIDNDGSRGPSLGDELVFTNSVQGPLGAATEYGSCLLHEVDLRAAAATLNCTITQKIGRSSITVQGSARTSLVVPPAPPRLLEPASFAITGGSGRFLGARGDATITGFEGSGLDFTASGRTRIVLGP